MGVPKKHLDADIEKIQAANGRMVWSISPCSCIKNAIQLVEDLFVEDGFDGGLKKKVKNPFLSGYKPELDVTNEVGDHLFLRYAQLIGILRWGIELGHVDVALETKLMVQYQANPRAGHLEVLYHMFVYLKSHPDMGQLAYDPKESMVDESILNGNAEWTFLYGDVEEELSPRIPAPRGTG
eukprot:10872364-Ditylum_brightwellii.AAC.1